MVLMSDVSVMARNLPEFPSYCSQLLSYGTNTGVNRRMDRGDTQEAEERRGWTESGTRLL